MHRLTLVALVSALVCFGVAMNASAGEMPAPGKQVATGLETPETTIDYLVFLPPEYGKAEKKWPLILFLHGAGERGDDLELVKKHGPPKIVGKDAEKLPFVVVSPQCPKNERWDPAELGQLLDHVLETYQVDEHRVYLTGLSMGGFGTWALAAKQPGRFAAIAPICGGGDPERAKNLKDVPTWVFHGDADKAVPLARSEEMVEALKAAGGDVKFTVYPGVGHNSWDPTYDNPELYKWFLSHSTKDRK